MLDNDVSVDMTTLNYIDITIELLETIKSKQLFFEMIAEKMIHLEY